MFVQTESHDYTSHFCTWRDLLLIPSTCNAIRKPSRICPSPLQRDVGINQQGVGGGEMQGGTHEVGGPSSASWKRAMTNVIACFLLFLLPSPAANTCYTQATPHHHLPCIQMWAGGGYCCRFDATPTTTTTLTSKCEPEVVFLIVSTQLPPPPPPSHPSASQR